MASKESLSAADNLIGFFICAVVTSGILGVDAIDGQISTAGIVGSSVGGIATAVFLARSVNAFSLMQRVHRDRLARINAIVPQK